MRRNRPVGAIREIDSFGHLIHDVARAVSAAYESRLKPVGLTRSQWQALLCAAREPGISQTTLARQLRVGTMSVTNAVDKLEKKGLLNRVVDEKDRRSKSLFLTNSALQMMPSLEAEGRVVLEELLEGIDECTRSTVLRALYRSCSTASAAGRKPARRSFPYRPPRAAMSRR